MATSPTELRIETKSFYSSLNSQEQGIYLKGVAAGMHSYRKSVESLLRTQLEEPTGDWQIGWTEAVKFIMSKLELEE